jgi:glutathione peroxidase
MIVKTLISACLIATVFYVQSSIYDISVESISGGKTVKLAEFAGSKFLIVTVRTDKSMDVKLDNIKKYLRNDKNLKILAVPVIDTKEKDNSILDKLNQFVAPGIVITRPANVLRSSGYEQHPLFKWLTDSKLNGHFDGDLDRTGTYFLVNAEGKLYAVLPEDTPAQVILDELSRNFTE